MTAIPRGLLADQVFEAMTDGCVMGQHLPMLLDPGIPDIGPTVHSHFLTFLVSVGQTMRFHAVAECPLWWSECIGNTEVRADSVWFHAQDLRPKIVFEFERFEKGDEGKLRYKVENLAIAAGVTPTMALCVLVYWVRSGSAPRQMDAIIASYRDGFRRNGRTIGSARPPLMIVKCVMRPSLGGARLVFGEFLRDGMNERLALGKA